MEIFFLWVFSNFNKYFYENLNLNFSLQNKKLQQKIISLLRVWNVFLLFFFFFSFFLSSFSLFFFWFFFQPQKILFLFFFSKSQKTKAMGTYLENYLESKEFFHIFIFFKNFILSKKKKVFLLYLLKFDETLLFWEN